MNPRLVAAMAVQCHGSAMGMGGIAVAVAVSNVNCKQVGDYCESPVPVLIFPRDYRDFILLLLLLQALGGGAPVAGKHVELRNIQPIFGVTNYAERPLSG